MLFKEYKDEENWKWTEYRYFCECHDPSHVLCFTIDDDERVDLEISINSNPYWGFWRRVKEAFRLIFGGEVVYLSVMINDDDRDELAAALKNEIIT